MSFDAPWIGWLEIDLGNGLGVSVATVDVNVRRDMVIFYIGNRNIAVIDRQQLQRWLVHPHNDLLQDDVVFLTLAGELCLSVDASVPYIVPKDAARELLQLV
ncbi:hypothetical protein GCM10022223_45570 [Kineosporia mesophila]|uniref:Uncharacterized protein n=1 Tax=Kineosporia mesophila TaxID=566012 RepID=A0ABP7A266_9ACTN|nr:hypothetical protein [Kineosporia mesophila]MCD5348975.1 hypothetical protein [Kineosporia mesophila]